MEIRNVVPVNPTIAIRIEGDFKDLDIQEIRRIVGLYHPDAEVSIRGKGRIGEGYLDVVSGHWESHQSVAPGFTGWLVVDGNQYGFWNDNEFWYDWRQIDERVLTDE